MTNSLRRLREVMDHENLLEAQEEAQGLAPRKPYVHRRRATDRRGLPGMGVWIAAVLSGVIWSMLMWTAMQFIHSPRAVEAPPEQPPAVSEYILVSGTSRPCFGLDEVEDAARSTALAANALYSRLSNYKRPRGEYWTPADEAHSVSTWAFVVLQRAQEAHESCLAQRRKGA